jgi:predicted secreted protein
MRKYGKSTTEIRVRVGESFVVELPVRATGGYAWQLARVPETARLSDERIRSAGAAIGGSSIQEFEFVATRAGEATLAMDCKRPWETTVSDRHEVKIVAES